MDAQHDGVAQLTSGRRVESIAEAQVRREPAGDVAVGVRDARGPAEHGLVLARGLEVDRRTQREREQRDHDEEEDRDGHVRGRARGLAVTQRSQREQLEPHRDDAGDDQRDHGDPDGVAIGPPVEQRADDQDHSADERDERREVTFAVAKRAEDARRRRADDDDPDRAERRQGARDGDHERNRAHGKEDGVPVGRARVLSLVSRLARLIATRPRTARRAGTVGPPAA